MAAIDPFTALSTAIESRLRLYFKPDRWDFEICPDAVDDVEFATLAGKRTPLLALSWREFNPEPKGGRRFGGKLGLRLTILVKNPSGRKWRFLGDRLGPGLYPAMSGAVILLNGHTVEGVGTIFVTAIAQAYATGFAEKNMAIATLDLSTEIAMGDVTGDFASAPDFLRALSDFDLPGEDDDTFDVRTS